MKTVSWKQIEKELTQEELKEFRKWMVGQTMSFDEKGENEVYEHDFERWKESKKTGIPPYFD